jgi:hypothetical protein
MSYDRFDIRRPGVFKTRLMETTRMPGGPENMIYPYRDPPPDFVRVDQTPAEARCTRESNYPRFDLLDVHNLPNRKRV